MSVGAIVNRIREHRQSVEGMTQEKLGTLCGVTRQTIIALEAGKYSPSLELAFRIAHALERTLDEVFQWSVKK
jgi:putative transcriptional regulator